jgi:hypothetical protein
MGAEGAPDKTEDCNHCNVMLELGIVGQTPENRIPETTLASSLG